MSDYIEYDSFNVQHFLSIVFTIFQREIVLTIKLAPYNNTFYIKLILFPEKLLICINSYIYFSYIFALVVSVYIYYFPLWNVYIYIYTWRYSTVYNMFVAVDGRKLWGIKRNGERGLGKEESETAFDGWNVNPAEWKDILHVSSRVAGERWGIIPRGIVKIKALSAFPEIISRQWILIG